MKGESVMPAAKIAKPEEMTHLNAHRVVAKDHPRIRFRGQLDQLQARIVLVQLELEREADHRELIDELEDILSLLRRVMRSEVLDEPLEDERILGLTLEELRAVSPLFGEDVYEALKLENCMALRSSYGGPAVSETTRQIKAIESFVEERTRR